MFSIVDIKLLLRCSWDRFNFVFKNYFCLLKTLKLEEISQGPEQPEIGPQLYVGNYEMYVFLEVRLHHVPQLLKAGCASKIRTTLLSPGVLHSSTLNFHQSVFQKFLAIAALQDWFVYHFLFIALGFQTVENVWISFVFFFF